MNELEEALALREAAVLHASERYGFACVRGKDCFAAVDRASTASLRLQHGQLRQSLFLNPDGTPLADVLVCRDEDAFLLLYEGPGPAALEVYLRSHAPSGSTFTVEDLSAAWGGLTLAGPWAWELLGEAFGPELMGMPYLSLYRVKAPGSGAELRIFRAGTTGEYGYELFAPRAELPALHARLQAVGARFGLREASTATLNQAALENGFFRLGFEGRSGLTPLELQLQWRLAPGKDFVGAQALRIRRQGGLKERLTHLLARGRLAPGDAVEFSGRRIGTVLAAGASLLRGDSVGVAALELPFAHAGLDAFEVRGADGPLPVRTAAPPHLNNRSLYVSALHHSFAARAEADLPPLLA